MINNAPSEIATWHQSPSSEFSSGLSLQNSRYNQSDWILSKAQMQRATGMYREYMKMASEFATQPKIQARRVYQYQSLFLKNAIKIMKVKYLLYLLAFLSIVGWGPFSFFNLFHHETVNNQAWLDHQISLINSQASNIDPNVLKLALNAYVHARSQGLDEKQLITIIDYSKPSTERRLWVLDLKKSKVLFNTWVSHGKNSGNIMATSFSNQPGSLKSSIGVFLTQQPYIGDNGYSLRLAGLEDGINNNALRRDIVVHGAWYADQNVIRKYGQLGRSWGCPAVAEKTARPLIDAIKNNTLVLMYYPDRNWLTKSTYIAG